MTEVYIAKPDTWFDEGSIVTLLDDYRPDLPCGLFSGLVGGEEDEEVCGFEEFELIEKEDV